jgi:hypothetical protein
MAHWSPTARRLGFRGNDGRNAHRVGCQCGTVPHAEQHRFCRSHDRWPPGNLADSQHPVPVVAEAPLLRSHRRSSIASGAPVGSRCARSPGSVRCAAARRLHARRRARRSPLSGSRRRALERGRDRARGMAGDGLAAGQIPQGGRHAAASSAGERRFDQRPCAVSQSPGPQRVRVGRCLAVGRLAIRRPLSAAGCVRRAGFGQDRSFKDPQGAG